MKKIIFIIIIVSGLVSCTVTRVPLKGQYSDIPFNSVSAKSMDTVWSSIIDLFATKGISIKLIDKSSGLIVSERTSFINNYTFEDATGKLKNQSAWIVVETVNMPLGGYVIPEKITGEWNVRIKSVLGKTSINVNLTNIEATKYMPATKYGPGYNITLQARSTGIFEQAISDLIR